MSHSNKYAMNSISAVPSTDTSPQQQKIDEHNTSPISVHPGEFLIRSRIIEQERRNIAERRTIPGSPPDPGYFRPEFPYEKRWRVNRAGSGLKRPKIKSIGRLNPEILRRWNQNQNTESDRTRQAVTVPDVLRVESTIQNSPRRLLSQHPHTGGVSEETGPSNDLTYTYGLHTPTNEPVSTGNDSTISFHLNNDNPQPESTDVQRGQNFDASSAAASHDKNVDKSSVTGSPDKKIQLPSIYQVQTRRWISATAGGSADREREADHIYQLLSEVPCSSKQADERDQLYLRQTEKHESENDADSVGPEITTSE
ncbi:MAG: hypothetical protein AB2693_06265, partial [Candidatus Thiodiazotropha sp.]